MSDNPVIKDTDLVLKTSGLQGAGAVTGTGVAMGPTGLVKAVIVVSVVATGGTLDVHLHEDTNDSGYSNVANGVFDQITAVGIYELYFRATMKWVCYVATVGVADVTWGMFVTTPEK